MAGPRMDGMPLETFVSSQDEQLPETPAEPRRQVYRVIGRPGPDDRPCVPPGHASSWDLINRGTVLDGSAYPADVLGRRGTLT